MKKYISKFDSLSSFKESYTPKSKTAKYYYSIVKKVLKDKIYIDRFMDDLLFSIDTKEWWGPWLGLSEKEIIQNIKDMSSNLPY